MARAKKEVIENVEKTEVPDLIFDAFSEAVESGKEEDDVKMAMIGAGAKFSNVTRLYNSYLEQAGLVTSKEEKQTIINETLEGKDLSDEETYNTVVKSLLENIKGASEKSAAAMVRAYGKKHELEVFKKAKASGGAGRQGFAAKFYSFLRTNPAATPDEVKEYVNTQPDRTEGTDVSQNVINHLSHYQGIAKLVNDIASAK